MHRPAPFGVDNANDLEGAMDSWLRHDGPALLDVKVSHLELIMPPKIEASQVIGTTMFGMKAVLDGRAGEVVNLLRNNFLR